jgi:hypothetical protein
MRCSHCRCHPQAHCPLFYLWCGLTRAASHSQQHPHVCNYTRSPFFPTSAYILRSAPYELHPLHSSPPPTFTPPTLPYALSVVRRRTNLAQHQAPRHKIKDTKKRKNTTFVGRAVSKPPTPLESGSCFTFIFCKNDIQNHKSTSTSLLSSPHPPLELPAYFTQQNFTPSNLLQTLLSTFSPIFFPNSTTSRSTTTPSAELHDALTCIAQVHKHRTPTHRRGEGGVHHEQQQAITDGAWRRASGGRQPGACVDGRRGTHGAHRRTPLPQSPAAGPAVHR